MLSFSLTLLVPLLPFLISYSEAFSVLPKSVLESHHLTPHHSRTVLSLKLNKQQELKKKMELAKKQNKKEEDDNDKTEKGRLTDKEIKERNDRLRFQEMLNKGAANVLSDYSSEGYLNKQQEEEEISAVRSGVDRIYEGDPAPTECFQELVSIKTENAIGARAAERLVPWLRKNPDRNDYLVIITDPRMKSPELRQTAQTFLSDLPIDIRSRLVMINADSPAENRRWLKKSGLEGKIDVYSDEKMEWMQAYTALGEKRWSMTMFIIADERVQKLAREVDVYAASRVVKNAVKSLNDARL